MECLQHIIIVVISLNIINIDAYRVKPCLLYIGNAAIAICRCESIQMPFRILHILINSRNRDSVLEFRVCICIGHIPQKPCRRILLKHLGAHNHRIRIILACKKTSNGIRIA